MSMVIPNKYIQNKQENLFHTKLMKIISYMIFSTVIYYTTFITTKIRRVIGAHEVYSQGHKVRHSFKETFQLKMINVLTNILQKSFRQPFGKQALN